MGLAMMAASIGTSAYIPEERSKHQREDIYTTSAPEDDQETPKESRQVRRAKARREAKRLGIRKWPKK